MSKFSRQLLRDWRALELPLANATVIVAVSGGADSTALLLALAELVRQGKLSVRLVVAHLDHSLRKSSKTDAQWVRSLSENLGLESISRRQNIANQARREGDNVEQAARLARYKFLGNVARQKKSSIVLTAHTLDDQAETILMSLMRGSGAEGLTGMPTVRPLRSDSLITLFRPLLTWARRSDTEAYCHRRGIEYLVDDMNHDEAFVRVRVRKQLLPLMLTFNNRLVETLGRTALQLRADSSILAQQAGLLLQAAQANSANGVPPRLRVNVLAEAPIALRRRALREWIAGFKGDLRRIELVHLLGVEKLLLGQQSGRVAELPGGFRVIRKGALLELTQEKG